MRQSSTPQPYDRLYTRDTSDDLRSRLRELEDPIHRSASAPPPRMLHSSSKSKTFTKLPPIEDESRHNIIETVENKSPDLENRDDVHQTGTLTHPHITRLKAVVRGMQAFREAGLDRRVKLMKDSMEISHFGDLSPATIVSDLAEFNSERPTQKELLNTIQIPQKKQNKVEHNDRSPRGESSVPIHSEDRRSTKSSASTKTFKRSKRNDSNKINMETLKQAFLKAAVPADNLNDEEEDAEVTEESFIEHFRFAFGNEKTDSELREMFNYVDADASGGINWAEFSTFLVMGKSRHKQETRSEKRELLLNSFDNGNTVLEKHSDMINRIVHNEKHDCYYTSSNDGTVRAWSSNDLRFMGMVYHSTNLITDIRCLSSGLDKELFISSIDRVINVFDCETHKLVKSFKGMKLRQDKREVQYRTEPFRWRSAVEIKANTVKRSASGSQSLTRILNPGHKRIEALNDKFHMRPDRIEMIVLEDLIDAPMCVEMYPRGSRLDESNLMVIGLDKGFVQMFDITPVIGQDKDDVAYLPNIKKWKPHESWITRIIATEMDSVVSSSVDGTIKVLNIEHSTSHRTLVGHRKGVYSIDWNKGYKLLASCGMERDVFIWNPFISKEVAQLQGHTAPLVDLCFNSNNHCELVTLASDKTIKLWDIRTFRCIQTFREKRTFRPQDRLTSLMYDRQNDRIITGTTELHVWTVNSEELSWTEPSQQTNRHQRPLITMLYDDYTKRLVTVDQKTIMTWDIMSGKVNFKFDVDKLISSACFDRRQRRILLGHEDGSLSVYNYSNGVRICMFKEVDSKEIEMLVNATRQDCSVIIGTGPGRKLLLWDVEAELEDLEFDVQQFPRLPHQIYCIEFVGNNMVAVGFEEGSIYLIDILLGNIHLKYIPYVHTDGELMQQRNETTIHRRSIGRRSDISYGETETVHQSQRTMNRQMGFRPTEYIEAMFFLQAKMHILVSSCSDGTVTFWNVQELQPIYIMTPSKNSTIITCITSNLDNTIMVVGDMDGVCHIYDISDLEIQSSNDDRIKGGVRLIQSFQAFSTPVIKVCYNSLYNLVLCASSSSRPIMFDLFGLVIGRFGQEHPWELGDANTYSKLRLKRVDDITEKNLAIHEQGFRQNGNNGKLDCGRKRNTSLGLDNLAHNFITTVSTRFLEMRERPKYVKNQPVDQSQREHLNSQKMVGNLLNSQRLKKLKDSEQQILSELHSSIHRTEGELTSVYRYPPKILKSSLYPMISQSEKHTERLSKLIKKNRITRSKS